LSINLTGVVRKAVAGWMSCRAFVLRNRIWAVARWNAIACSFGNTFVRDRSLTVKRWSAARDVLVPTISSGKSLMMFLMYSLLPRN